MKVLYDLSSYEGVRTTPGPRRGEESGQSLLLGLLTSALREMLAGRPFPCGPLSPGSDNPCLEPREEQAPQLTQLQSLGVRSWVSVVHGVLDIHKPHPLPALPLLRHLQFQQRHSDQLQVLLLLDVLPKCLTVLLRASASKL